MARTMFRDGGGGRRRALARLMTSAFCLLLISTLTAGCDLNDPTSPNSQAQLTGQTTNQQFNFSGTIGVTSVSGTVIADDNSTLTIFATVRDQAGNPIPNLTQVTFTTNLGAFLVDDGTGALVPSTTARGATFNGVAEALFVSSGQATGTATVTASLGNVVSTTQVEIEPAPIRGTIALEFGSGGVIASGIASTALPFDAPIALEALNLDGDPIVGANVSFRILQDTTGDNTNNPYAEFVASRHTSTGAAGDAANILRAFGPGVVVVVAELYDPNSGELVGTSNRIILTTANTFLLSQTFQDGSTSFAFGAGGGTVRIDALATDANFNPQQSLTVRFTIVSDTTTAGASLSAPLAVSDPTGVASTTLTVPDDGGGAGSIVTVRAEIISATGTVIATANIVTATAS